MYGSGQSETLSLIPAARNRNCAGKYLVSLRRSFCVLKQKRVKTTNDQLTEQSQVNVRFVQIFPCDELRYN